MFSFVSGSMNATRDTECYCGVRYFQLPQFIEPYRVRSAIPPPNEKASCAEYSDPGFCCITSAELPPKSSGSPFGSATVVNTTQFGGLSMSLTCSAYSGDTECYATEIEQSALGAITKPIDQVGAFITAVVLFGNVIPRLWPARILLVESIQFRKIALGAPLLSISRNAAEWLADLNDSVTLLLSPILNVFNGDTEN